MNDQIANTNSSASGRNSLSPFSVFVAVYSWTVINVLSLLGSSYNFLLRPQTAARSVQLEAIITPSVFPTEDGTHNARSVETQTERGGAAAAVRKFQSEIISSSAGGQVVFW